MFEILQTNFIEKLKSWFVQLYISVNGRVLNIVKSFIEQNLNYKNTYVCVCKRSSYNTPFVFSKYWKSTLTCIIQNIRNTRSHRNMDDVKSLRILRDKNVNQKRRHTLSSLLIRSLVIML